jgi:hypothetical protein
MLTTFFPFIFLVAQVNSKMLTTFFGALMALDRSRQALAS